MAITNASKLASYVGAAITADGASGIVTANQFVGDFTTEIGIGLTADVSTSSLVVAGISTLGNVTAGVATANQFSGNITGTAATFTTFNGNITGTAATFTGNVTIGGTLTYDDVTNIDSIGIVTARSGVRILDGGLDVVGVATFKDNVDLGDSDRIRLGASQDLQIYHDGSNSTITNTTGDLYVTDSGGNIYIQSKAGEQSIVAFADGAVDLYYDNAKKLETTTSGVTVTGNILPEANGTRDLGATGTRWANIYTSDLDLSNESKGGNDVDGSWGAYTIQEGEDDLFLINRRNGKTYKFVLQEVS